MGYQFSPATNHYLHEQRYRFLLQGLHTVHILLVQRRVINQLTSLRASCLVTIADVLLLHYSKPVLCFESNQIYIQQSISENSRDKKMYPLFLNVLSVQLNPDFFPSEPIGANNALGQTVLAVLSS